MTLVTVMNKMFHTSLTVVLIVLFGVSVVHAVPIYLNDQNLSVSLGPGTNPVSRPATDPFNNLSTAQSLANVIDAPSASASELHNQSTHVWVTGTLELVFDLGQELDLTTFHFWNYHTENFDVDDIDLTFRDGSMNFVGSIVDISPALGNATGSDSTAIFAQNIALSFPAKVQFVSAVLSGSNTQVDFNNIGFTAEVSDDEVPVPEPGSWLLMAFGALLLAALKIRGNGSCA
jgi:hypothetical protein